MLTRFCNDVKFKSDIISVQGCIHLKAIAKSFIYIYKRNHNGPRQDPYGTPQLISSSSEKLFEFFCILPNQIKRFLSHTKIIF